MFIRYWILLEINSLITNKNKIFIVLKIGLLDLLLYDEIAVACCYTWYEWLDDTS